MKFLLTSLIIISSLLAKAQLNSTRLVGTWEISEFTYKGESVVPGLHGIKKYKIYTPFHFAVIVINAENNTIVTTLFGTYTLTDTAYSEHISNTDVRVMQMMGGNYAAIVKFDGEENMSMVGRQQGELMDERWKKVKGSPFDTFSK